jgi:NADH:ubiquinone oxidoreductase subunit K
LYQILLTIVKKTLRHPEILKVVVVVVAAAAAAVVMVIIINTFYQVESSGL